MLLLEFSFVFDKIGTQQKGQEGSISEALSMFRDLPPNHLHCNSVYLNLSIYTVLDTVYQTQLLTARAVPC